MPRDGFIVHDKTIKQIGLLTTEQAGQLLRAMIAAYKGEQAPASDQLIDVLMVDVKERMAADAEAYEKRAQACKTAAEARWNMRTHTDASERIAGAMPTVCVDHASNAVSVSVSDSVSVKKDKKIFVPPTLEEVTAYCKERGGKVDPQRWLDFYTGKGFMVGKSKMRDWKACVRTWERDDKPKAAAPKYAQMMTRQYDYAALEKAVLGGRT